MVEAFQRMETLRGFVDDNFSGRDWNLASAMVINGEALFQIMGDWAKGEFVNAGQTAGRGLPVLPRAGHRGHRDLQLRPVRDVQRDRRSRPGLAARHGLRRDEPGVPGRLQRREGLGPARTDVPSDAFDACGQKGMAAPGRGRRERHALRLDGAWPRQPASVQNAMYDVITAHFNGEYDAETAAQELVTAVEIAQ
jgi:glucose/mannose transport system substrate-binding protein